MLFILLREGLGYVRRWPTLWILGLISGILGSGTLLLQFFAGTFYSERIGIIQLIILPFFIGGGLFTIKEGRGSIQALLEGGRRYYLRILLASVVILFLTLIIMILVVITLAILGIMVDGTLLPIIVGGVLVPVLFFTFFYDTAIVFEDRKVVDALRRSIEFVINGSFRVFLFIMLNLLLFIGIIAVAFTLMALWLGERLDPLVIQNLTVTTTIEPSMLLDVLGVDGAMLTAVIYLISLTIGVTILYSYKAAFFRRMAAIAPPSNGGVYDEKGRWYKY